MLGLLQHRWLMAIFSSSPRRSDAPFNIHRHQGHRQGMYRYAAKTVTHIINIGKKNGS